MSVDELQVIVADYTNAEHMAELLRLLDNYARDPMGGGRPLSAHVHQHLPAALAARSDAISLIAYIAGRGVGLINAFEGFSTFQCRPLLNIHDVCVDEAYRRRGVATEMIRLLEKLARERGCCKLTLEVLQGNEAARRAYQGLGFQAYELDPAMGAAQFWEKSLQ